MEILATRHEVLFSEIFTLISVPKLRELITWAMSGLSGCKTNKTKINLILLVRSEGGDGETEPETYKNVELTVAHLSTCSMGGHMEITRNLMRDKKLSLTHCPHTCQKNQF